jgi:hypothetical protein
VALQGEGDRPFGFAREELADRHPSRELVEDRPEPGDQVGEVGLVTIVEVTLPGPERGALDLGVGEQLGMLEEGVEDVEPEAIDAACEPAADHVELGGLDRRVPPVQLGLFDQERVHVEL